MIDVVFQHQNPPFKFDPVHIPALISKITEVENRKVDWINVILADQPFIRELNKNYLNHDYDTDVIAFPFHEKEAPVSGEIYINIDQAMIQSEDFKVSPYDETNRLIIHGVLHLLGYDDKDEQLKKQMRSKEDEFLLLI